MFRPRYAGCSRELWAATTDGTEKIMHLGEVTYAEYCFSDREGKHLSIAGPCTVSTNNDDKLKLYEAVPILKKILKTWQNLNMLLFE